MQNRTGPVVLALGLTLAGCHSANTELMPMSAKKSWTYLVRPGIRTFAGRLVASRPIAVGDAMGWELTGELGTSRLAWSGSRLITDEMANARFQPPLPLLTDSERPTVWRGFVETLGHRQPAKATIECAPDTLKLGVQTLGTVKSRVLLKMGARTLELATWFQSGVGIVQQQQSSDGVLDLSVQLSADFPVEASS